MSHIKKVANTIFLTILFILMGLFILNLRQGNVPSVFGYRVFRVVSQSMMPKIPDATCIIIKKVDPKGLQVGDIITFRSEDPDIYGYYNTHRIEEITTNPVTKEMEFITKGDSNDYVDAYPVPANNIVGKYVRILPFGFAVAKFINLLSDQRVYFVVIMVPIFISLLMYIWQLINLIFTKEEVIEEEQEEVDEEEQEPS